MNSENAPKEIVQPFIDFVNMAKGLMDENQQPFVPQELGRLFLSARVGGRRGESREFLRVGAGESSASATGTNNTSFAMQSTTKLGIEEIWESKALLKKPQKSMPHKTTSGKTLSKFAILFHVKPSDFRFVTWFKSFLNFGLHNCSLKFSKQKLSCFKPFQSCPKGI